MKKLKLFVASIALTAAVLASSVSFANDHVCTPTEVSVIYVQGSSTNRVHVRCSTAAQGYFSQYWYFAVPWSNAELSKRFLSMATTALVSGRKIKMSFSLPSSGYAPEAAWGCAMNDCRQPWAFTLQ